jgi:5-methylcytosine-specific restriction protein A
MPHQPPIHRPPGWQPPKARQQALDQRRGTSSQRGYDAAWRRFRARYLAANPYCCTPSCRRAATEVDHVLSIRERPDLRLDPSNCRPFCKPCHSRRTALEQGFAVQGAMRD